MVYFILDKYNTSNLNQPLIDFIKGYIVPNNINYRIKFIRKFIYDHFISEIKQDDFVFWNPVVVSNNMHYAHEYISYVLLLKPTDLSQRLTEEHPFNENVAINHNLYVTYLQEDSEQNQPTHYKLPVDRDTYFRSKEFILDLIMAKSENILETENKHKETFSDIKQNLNEVTSYFKEI